MTALNCMAPNIPDWSSDSYTGYGMGSEPWNRAYEEDEDDEIKLKALKKASAREVIKESKHESFNLVSAALYKSDIEKLFYLMGKKGYADLDRIDESDIADAISSLLDEVEEWSSLEY